ncbi:MAG: alpha/beta fold hydrolase [Legionellaceae bacterium]|nr:alpha/beta fold hydrolase [Legionellaceae bacterium]
MRPLYYTEKGQGPAVVLLHGWGFDHQVWQYLANGLAEDFHLFCPDLPGHGRTAAMSHGEFYQQLLAVLPDSFSLLGWSLGGIYALKMASSYPERIRCLITISSSPYFLADTNWCGISETVFNRFYERYQADPDRTIREFIQIQSATGLDNPSMPLPRQGCDLQTGLDMLKSWDLRPDLQALALPVFYLLGGRDSIVPRRLATQLQNYYTHVHTTLWPKAAHMPFVSHQAACLSFIKESLLCPGIL